MPIKQKINFLVVEDMVSDSFLLQRQLKKACEDPEIRFADSQLSLINALKSYVPDFVLCDFNLNGFDAFDVIEIIKDYNAIIPVIVITGQLKVEESAETLIEKGASGFFLKDPMDQLHEKLESYDPCRPKTCHTPKKCAHLVAERTKAFPNNSYPPKNTQKRKK